MGTTSDVLGEWLEENCKRGADLKEKSMILKADFQEYTGIDLHPKTFKRYMERKGLVHKPVGGTPYYLGVEITDRPLVITVRGPEKENDVSHLDIPDDK